MSTAIVVLLSVAAGAALGGLGLYLTAFSIKKKSEAELTGERDALKNQFAALSQQALAAATEQFLQLAKSRLETESERQGAEIDDKRRAVETAVNSLNERLKSYEELVRGFEKDREKKYGSLEAQIRSAISTTERLQGTTESLQSMLSNSRTRGQWGERMAEDILRACGLQEGVQYEKNKAQETVATRPDYTFFLPDGHKFHMDVKFPLDNYMRLVNAAKDEERARFKTEFLRDAKARIKEVTKRDYINPDEKTLDYMLLFIPNEQVYGFLQEADPSLMDEAMKLRVVLCSPFTLFAALRIIRQAYDNFHFTKATEEIVHLVAAFRQTFEKFRDRFARLGEQLDKTQGVYDEILQTSFKRLDSAVSKIERISRGEDTLPEPEAGSPTPSATNELPDGGRGRSAGASTAPALPGGEN